MRTSQLLSFGLAARRPRWNVVAVYSVALFFGIVFWLWLGRTLIGLLVN